MSPSLLTHQIVKQYEVVGRIHNYTCVCRIKMIFIYSCACDVSFEIFVRESELLVFFPLLRVLYFFFFRRLITDGVATTFQVKVLIS